MKRISILIACVSLWSVAFSQGPVLTQKDIMTYAYEDFSDFLRLYPGMYPLDFGTLGAPVLFSPYSLSPWSLRVYRDGILQNRSYDGLYSSNLQPASEAGLLTYAFPGRAPAGDFRLATRALPVDSPLTEFQIREGYYGYGTVDFAHGQKVYNSATLEITGRLAWYNGRRDFSAVRFNRVRGRIGANIHHRWRANFTFAGSNVSTNINEADIYYLADANPYEERQEGIVEITGTDSFRTSLSPTLRLFVRQDREHWGNEFRARELTRGWVWAAQAALPGQRIAFSQSLYFSTIDYPGLSRGQSLSAEVRLSDSVDMRAATLVAQGSLELQQLRAAGGRNHSDLLPSAGVTLYGDTLGSLYSRAGLCYMEQAVPIGWRYGSYNIAMRPLQIAPLFGKGPVDSFDGSTAWYVGNPGHVDSPDKSQYLNSVAGFGWIRGTGSVDLSVLRIDEVSTTASGFTVVADTAITYAETGTQPETQWVGAVTADIPLTYGLRIQSTAFRQFSEGNPANQVDTRTYSRLYFERAFFRTPLIVRAHISHQYFDERAASSNLASAVIDPAHVVGFRLSAQIRGVTLIWGTENLFREKYEILPGYPMIGKEEYIGVIWRLWL